MKIFFIPIIMGELKKKTESDGDIIFLQRDGEKPQVFMHHVQIVETRKNKYGGNSDYTFIINGDFPGNQSFSMLQENDRLFINIHSSYADEVFPPFYLDMYVVGEMLLPFESTTNTLDIAAGMEKSPEIYLTTTANQPLLNRAKQIHDKAKALYESHPEYEHIMLKTKEGIISRSLTDLAAAQPKEKHEELSALFLAMSSLFKTQVTISNRILEQCEFEDEFSLLTQEEQVGMFIEFSKMAASRKKEYVTDQMIEQIKASPEYIQVLSDLERNELGVSETQQFNVFQSVGYFSEMHSNAKRNILYNLSDMGAGKTLMTVESIYMLDLKQISEYAKWKENYTDQLRENITICKEALLPDKQIIAPLLSIKSSWIDTFRLFYEVDEIDDMTYELTLTYQNVTAKSQIYVAPFTVKNGKIFTKKKLPDVVAGSYLIIDEIHQLVHQNIAKTKFFPANTNPAEWYKVFVLSGTMSNMKTQQWYHFLRFMGITLSNEKLRDLVDETRDLKVKYRNSIAESAKTLRTGQHRYFDTEDLTSKNTYYHERTKKQTGIEENFFTKYSTQIINPVFPIEDNSSYSVESLLASDRMDFIVETDPREIDAINFELFYQIVGSQAITAQSMQIAEELFGEQKKQHVSDIIKTVSPLSKSDIQILKVLHHIAENHNQYKSPTIAKAINNAILNLNDGLQTKNIYDIVSGYAERNIRFFEYLSTLDVNILEQLPASGLIKTPKLQDTDKFKVLQDILRREKDETHLIVVNDYYALKSLSEALGIEHLTKDQLKHEMDYQDILDELFEKQSIVIVTQDMIKSSLDLVQANRLIQYQLNTEISDIIQTQNRINRIGQRRETRGYYIASDQLQENLIELFLESYRNIRVAHKGIVELFADITSQINVVNDYLDRAFVAIDQSENEEPPEAQEESVELEAETEVTDLISKNTLPGDAVIACDGDISRAILFPQNGSVMVLVPLATGNAFPYGQLSPEKVLALNITAPVQIMWNLTTDTIEQSA